MNNDSTENSGQNNTDAGAGNENDSDNTESKSAEDTLYNKEGDNGDTNDGDAGGDTGGDDGKDSDGKTDDKDAGKSDDGDKKDGDDKDGAPEKYEFKFDDGIIVDETILGEFADFAKEKGLNQEDAQKIADFGPKIAQHIAEKQMAQMEETTNAWANEMKTDKEIGGDKLDENLAVAKKALDTLGTPELSKLLGRFDAEENPGGTGFGNHPEVIRFFHKVGTSLGEDKFIGGGGTNKGTASAESVLYDKTK